MLFSTPDRPPWLGPALPAYPARRQVVRVRAPGVGGNVYPCYVQQRQDGAVALRDREPAYCWEPNGIALVSAYYRARLVGSYLGLPLYFVGLACCAPVPFSSASPSAASSLASSPSAFSSAASSRGPSSPGPSSPGASSPGPSSPGPSSPGPSSPSHMPSSSSSSPSPAPCCGLNQPSQGLHLTLTDANCPCFNQALPLFWVSSNTWSQDFTCHAVPLTATLTCTPGVGWSLQIAQSGGGNVLSTSGPFPEVSCSPFDTGVHTANYTGGSVVCPGFPTGTFTWEATI